MNKNKKIRVSWGNFSPSGFSELQWYVALGVVVATLLIGWTSMMGLLGFNVSLHNILYLHHYFFVWVFDLCVLAVLAAILYISNFKAKKLSEMRDEIDGLRSTIKESIIMADNIREGHDVDSRTARKSDIGRTLLNLGQSLHDSREKETFANWVSKGKETISDILRANTRIDDLAEATIEGLISYCNAVQAAFYLLDGDKLRTVTQYAYDSKRYEKVEIKVGYGLIGAAAYEKQLIYRTEIPDDYFTISSGLIGKSRPKSLLIIPLKQEEEVQGVIEVSFFQDKLPQDYMLLAEEVCNIVGSTLYNLKINERTESLLRESQQMTAALRKNEEQLNENAREMREAKENLEISNSELNSKIEEIKAQQKKQDAMLSNASEFISIYDKDREVVYESPSMKRILGYGPDEDIHGMMPTSFKKVQKMFDYLLSTPGGETKIEYTYLKKNNERIYLETQGKNLIHDPAIRGLIFNTRDVTERKMRENEEKKTGRMKSLSENSPDVIIRTSLKGKILYANPAAAKFLSISSSDKVKDKAFVELLDDEPFRNFVADTLKGAKRSKRQETAEIELGDKDKLFKEVKAIPEMDENGSVDSVLFTVHDVTEIKKLEQEAQKARADVMSALDYAKPIQCALLPAEQELQSFFPNSFMFYRPKNIVSGDFPWSYHKDGITYVAVVDCTGHGVPGALLSIIGYLLLSNIVTNHPELNPAQILDMLHEAVRDALKQKTSEANAGDGMDLALIRIHPAEHEIQFSGAHRPLYYLHRGRHGQFDSGDDAIFQEFEATRKGIGGKPLPNGRKEKPFENNVITYETGDRIFVFSDGLPDQLGGEEHKKFFTRRVKEWLARNVNESMSATSKDLVKTFYDWKGTDKQVDDVLLIGVEL